MNIQLAKIIDHTNLKPDATKKDIEKLCDEAIEHGFASVCVNPYWVKFAAEKLKGSGIKVCSVIGFPLGANKTVTKMFETRQAVIDGADEIDMVANIGFIKAGNEFDVFDDIKAVMSATEGKPLKVIIETCLLTDEEKIMACKCIKQAGAAFAKTSTGFSTGGATVEDVKLMRKALGDNIEIKAAGGIRDAKTAIALIEAGATRIGASKSIEICRETE